MQINPTLVGIALIVLGMVAFAYQGITYTSRETVIDIGPIHATADTQKTIPLSPLLGGLALVGGIVLVVVGAKKSIVAAVRPAPAMSWSKSIVDQFLKNWTGGI